MGNLDGDHAASEDRPTAHQVDRSAPSSHPATTSTETRRGAGNARSTPAAANDTGEGDRRRRSQDADPGGAAGRNSLGGGQPPRSSSISRQPSSVYDRRASAQIGGFLNDYDADNLEPSRWWFAATAFPMMAGTLGPVASAFSICALVRPWRQEILPGTNIQTAVFIADPVWYFSAITLVVLTSTASGPLQDGISPEKHLVWSQAFYYAIYSAVLYTIVASLMVFTFVGAWTGHYAKDFQLTNSQRTLMLQTIMFLVYLLVGALVFSNVEGWAYLDAVYWADVTLFTVGFGDFAASTTLGRALLFPYALIGVISLGLVIGSIRSLALERGKRRLDARMTEVNRRRFLRRMARQGKDGILQPIHDRASDHEGGEDDDDEHGGRNRRSRDRGSFLRSRYRNGTGTGLTEYERREMEFNIMREIQRKAARRRRWLAMATSGGTWVALWLIGAYIFQSCEHPYQHWNYFNGFYLAFVSLTTIGYGDMVPISNAGKSFFVFWSLLALPTTTVLISNAGDTIVKGISDATNAIGSITILPGEHGLRRDLKGVVRALTCGAVFDDVDIEDVPPGLLGAAQPNSSEREESLVEEEEANEEEAEAAVDEAEQAMEEKDDVDDAADDAAAEDAQQAGCDKPTSSGSASSGTTSDATKNSSRTAGVPPKYGAGLDGKTSQEQRTHSSLSADTIVGDAAFLPRPPNRADAPTSTEAAETSGKATPSAGTPAKKANAQANVLSPSRSQAATDISTAEHSTTAGHTMRRRHRHKHREHSPGGSPSGTTPRGGRGGGATAGYPLGSVPTASMPRLDIPQELPRTRVEYQCVLADEIARVTQHMRHTPPRKYTFQEWAWFLRLIGEDEHSAALHRKPYSDFRRKGRTAISGQRHRRHAHEHGAPASKNPSNETDADAADVDADAENVDAKGSKEDNNSITASTTTVDAAAASAATDLHVDNDAMTPRSSQWSWVGARSPLMSSQEEAEWILDKLMKRLQVELRANLEQRRDKDEGEQQQQQQQQQQHSGDPGSGPADDPRPYASRPTRRSTLPIEEEP
ncbi:potassium channel [Niveomyces insectorum RCEF 264]|uniref:Potassium channel n=1 Tax=Niveomyces insectorum RCEF 264 TaxID=1081102 RepID=A0A162KAG4_9HYPO|nr:potassium channel [Niveomyces insectorum RCEF 264]